MPNFLKKQIFDIKKLNFFLPVLIIFSSLKVYGYVFVFFLYLPYIYKIRKKLFTSIKKANFNEKFIICFSIFILLEIFYGAYFINDIRIIIYWIPFLIVVIGSYFKNIFDMQNCGFYKENYLKIIFQASLIYFIFYFILNFTSYYFVRDFYSIQDNFWIGSSSAFGIASLLFFSFYELWEKNNFKLFSKYTLALSFFILITLINETRLGVLYIAAFVIFIIIRNIQLKKYLNSFFIFLFVFVIYSTFSFGLEHFHKNFANCDTTDKECSSYHTTSNIISDSSNILGQNDQRINELNKGKNKFLEYPTINKLFGTGWYSSRITIKYNRNDIHNREFDFKNDTSYSLQAIVAILLDTGIIGISLFLSLYFLTLISIFRQRDYLLKRLFLITLLGLNFLCLFIGYPLVNIAYLLFLVPNGILLKSSEN